MGAAQVTDRSEWMAQIMRWWSVGLDTAQIAKLSGKPEHRIERDLHFALDMRKRHAADQVRE